ncbi:Bacterial sugar transferase [compost metagenome]
MGEYYEHIVKCKPGITGPWQISGRSNIDFNDRLEIDYNYYNENSLKNDMNIVVKTIDSAINGKGAL